MGRDHISATVNTLVLAYVGSSLPVLIILGSGQMGIVDAVNLEIIAKEIVATLVGSIGLIAAVPITTALAALMAARFQTKNFRKPPTAAITTEPGFGVRRLDLQACGEQG